MSLFDDRLKQLRLITWIEGISYLVLLLVAMPMKYLAGQPEWVRIVGLIHGVLFVLFCFSLLQAKLELQWPNRRALRIFLSSLVPFGMLMFDRLLETPDRASA